MFRKISTTALTLIFTLSGIGLLWLWMQLKPKLLGLSSILEPLVIFLFFFLGGCTGLVWFIRKEALQVIPLRGTSAQVLGMTLLIVGWGFAIYTIWLTVFKK